MKVKSYGTIKHFQAFRNGYFERIFKPVLTKVQRLSSAARKSEPSVNRLVETIPTAKNHRFWVDTQILQGNWSYWVERVKQIVQYFSSYVRLHWCSFHSQTSWGDYSWLNLQVSYQSSKSLLKNSLLHTESHLFTCFYPIRLFSMFRESVRYISENGPVCIK